MADKPCPVCGNRPLVFSSWHTGANFDLAVDTSDERLFAMLHQQEAARSQTNDPMYSDAELHEQLSRLHIDAMQDAELVQQHNSVSDMEWAGEIQLQDERERLEKGLRDERARQREEEEVRQMAEWDWIFSSNDNGPEEWQKIVEGLVIRPDIPPAEEEDCRSKERSLASITKIEALAMVGAELYTVVAQRKVRDNSTARKIDKPIKRQKFILPSGTRATWDRFGRPHVVPDWHTHSANEPFLNALHLRISIVKCGPVNKATYDDIMRAAESYLATMQKIYRDFDGLATPKGWSFRADRNAAFRDRDLTAAGL
ncbi:hypothetical protein FIBSPDRAFT_965611 [Athelia psychrophila]|uniref:Uncharacterized protein n=1 Tax=Athelia psychrophila TaxID=1759441 RepID=A0A167XQB4_9AGAM|nr:hypothetical protein FIBSPDRAFT_965611 [Fibularhizoctonia sp. CBS 109695]